MRSGGYVGSGGYVRSGGYVQSGDKKQTLLYSSWVKTTEVQRIQLNNQCATGSFFFFKSSLWLIPDQNF